MTESDQYEGKETRNELGQDYYAGYYWYKCVLIL